MPLPEDKKTRPGWWIFSWPWKTDFDEAVEWHDKATSNDSSHERLEIPGHLVDEYFGVQVKELVKAKRSGLFQRVLGKTFSGIVVVLGRWFQKQRYFRKGE